MKNYLEKHYRATGILGTLIALAVATTYLLVVPEEASGAPLLQKSILLYGHSVCWFLLAAASSIWAIKNKNKWSVSLAYAALAVYVTFIATLVISKL